MFNKGTAAPSAACRWQLVAQEVNRYARRTGLIRGWRVLAGCQGQPRCSTAPPHFDSTVCAPTLALRLGPAVIPRTPLLADSMASLMLVHSQLTLSECLTSALLLLLPGLPWNSPLCLLSAMLHSYLAYLS